MKIYSKKNTPNYKKIKLFGLTLYKKEKKNYALVKKYLMGMFKIKQQGLNTKYYFLGVQLLKKKSPATFDSLKRAIVAENRVMLSVYNLHSKVFPKFKNCNLDKSVVIVGCGPTMNYYTYQNDYTHIGLNKAYKSKEINLDYLFFVDNAYKGNSFEETIELNCTKFFGLHCNPEFSYCNENALYDENNTSFCLIPEIHAIKNNAYRFYSNAHRNEIFYDIETSPLMDFGSVSFPAIHFALYTHPKRIFLVGCDCANNGYFNNEKQPTWQDHMLNRTVMGYNKLKKFVSVYYPDTEIVSVNPIGLKGLFKDVYTKNYIKDNPQIVEETPNIIYLDEIENKETVL